MREIKEEKKVPETPQSFKIMVLSGTGDKKSATAMAQKLKGLGYRVARVDMGRKSDSKVNTVYYKERYLSEAEKLAKEIEGEAKKLSWKSEFELIVITGKSRR